MKCKWVGFATLVMLAGCGSAPGDDGSKRATARSTSACTDECDQGGASSEDRYAGTWTGAPGTREDFPNGRVVGLTIDADGNKATVRSLRADDHSPGLCYYAGGVDRCDGDRVVCRDGNVSRTARCPQGELRSYTDEGSIRSRPPPTATGGELHVTFPDGRTGWDFAVTLEGDELVLRDISRGGTSRLRRE